MFSGRESHHREATEIGRHVACGRTKCIRMQVLEHSCPAHSPS